MLHLELQFLKVVVILSLAVAIALASWTALTAASRAIVVSHTPVTLRISGSETTSQIATALQRARVIRSATAFRALAGIQLASRGIHAGVYHFVRYMRIARVLTMLTAARPVAAGVATPAPAKP